MSSAALSCLFWAIAVLGVVGAVRGARAMTSLRLLPPLRRGSERRPRVSVVVAARDEEARIETTVRRLLAQEGVTSEVIVVDDRSGDRTGEILRRLAGEDARLHVVRVDSLPEGWLGKCHACHVGAGRATGEWLLFTDGDIWLAPDVVARAVRQAEDEQADHVTLMPGVRRATFLGSVGQLIFSVGMGRRAECVNRARPGAYLGIGAFNLVRAEAYRAIGGHEPLRMEVADDLKLGLLLRRGGRRSRVYFAPRDADADWCADVPGIVKDLEKNHFAVTGYRLGRVALAVAVIGVFWGTALAGPWTGTASGIAAGVGLASLSVPAMIAAVRLGRPVVTALLVPLFLPVLAVCLLNSAVVTLRQGGVRWRDTFYSLEALRAGSVR